MHHLTAGSCNDGPCPDLTHDPVRRKTGGQGYVPDPRHLSPDLLATPAGEVRWEMDDHVFEQLLARHLTEDALGRIAELRHRNVERTA